MQCGCLLQHGLLIGCRGNICSTTVCSTDCRGISALPLEHLLPLLPRPSCSQCCFSLVFLTPLFVWHFCPSFKYFFTEVPPALLMGSIVSCGRSAEELAGTDCVQHGATPGLLPQRPALQPHHPPSETSDQYFRESKNHNNQSSYTYL